MKHRDENDLTDEELLEMWEQGEPVELTRQHGAPSSAKEAEDASPTTPARRREAEQRRDA